MKAHPVKWTLMKATLSKGWIREGCCQFSHPFASFCSPIRIAEFLLRKGTALHQSEQWEHWGSLEQVLQTLGKLGTPQQCLTQEIYILKVDRWKKGKLCSNLYLPWGYIPCSFGSSGQELRGSQQWGQEKCDQPMCVPLAVTKKSVG